MDNYKNLNKKLAENYIHVSHQCLMDQMEFVEMITAFVIAKNIVLPRKITEQLDKCMNVPERMLDARSELYSGDDYEKPTWH